MTSSSIDYSFKSLSCHVMSSILLVCRKTLFIACMWQRRVSDYGILACLHITPLALEVAWVTMLSDQ